MFEPDATRRSEGADRRRAENVEYLDEWAVFPDAAQFPPRLRALLSWALSMHLALDAPVLVA